ncbi:cysteine desulfurase family protein [Acidobacteriota bacterium]
MIMKRYPCQQFIYLDNQATTPVDPRAVEAMMPYFTESYGNPSNMSHRLGSDASAAIEVSRKNLAHFVGAATEKEILFTSGATESNNLAIIGVTEKLRKQGNHIITSSVEHPSIMATCKSLEKNGFDVTFLPVDSDGLVNPSNLEAALTDHTILVSIMHVNNEIGTIQPLEEIGSMTRERGVIFHTDATQSLGKIPFDVDKLKIDLASFSAHKVYGPKGAGALYVRGRPRRINLEPRLKGGEQEFGLRPGTQNVPGIVGFGTAVQILQSEAAKEARRILDLRRRFRLLLLRALDNIRINGSLEQRVPQNLSVCFDGVDAEELMRLLPEVAMSSGSACSSGTAEPSHVLMALGLDKKRARSTIRFSFGRFNTLQDVEAAAARIVKKVSVLRSIAPSNIGN